MDFVELKIERHLFNAVLCAMDNAVNDDYVGDEWFLSAWNALLEADRK